MIKCEIPEDTAFIGALSLDGSVVKADGLLPALISAKKLGIKQIYFPHDPLIPVHMLITAIKMYQLCHLIYH